MRGEMAGVLGLRVTRTFELMGVAEARASGHPKAFLVVRPSAPLLDHETLRPDVYRHHCQELVGRLARGEDTGPGTDAELLVALMVTSLRTPLATWATALYEALLARVLPDEAKQLGLPHTSEDWAGQVVEAERSMRWRLRQKWRDPKNL